MVLTKNQTFEYSRKRPEFWEVDRERPELREVGRQRPEYWEVGRQRPELWEVGGLRAVAAVAVQVSDVYMFDEPSSYLQLPRHEAAPHGHAHDLQVLDHSELGGHRYVIMVEHDLAVLDYLSDYVRVLYGSMGAYGVVTMPFAVRMGIYAFLAGFIPT